MKPSEIAFFCDNVEETARFYEQLLGQPPVHSGPGIAIFRVGRFQILVHTTYEPKPGEPPGENHFGFSVPDVDAACNALQDSGLIIERPPRDYEWGQSAYLRAPDGTLVELHGE